MGEKNSTTTLLSVFELLDKQFQKFKVAKEQAEADAQQIMWAYGALGSRADEWGVEIILTLPEGPSLIFSPSVIFYVERGSIRHYEVIGAPSSWPEIYTRCIKEFIAGNIEARLDWFPPS